MFLQLHLSFKKRHSLFKPNKNRNQHCGFSAEKPFGSPLLRAVPEQLYLPEVLLT